MEANINFQLPEEKHNLLRAMKATEAYLVIWDMFQELRKVYKYSEDEQAVEDANKWRDTLQELCDQYGVDVYSEFG